MINGWLLLQLCMRAQIWICGSLLHAMSVCLGKCVRSMMTMSWPQTGQSNYPEDPNRGDPSGSLPPKVSSITYSPAESEDTPRSHHLLCLGPPFPRSLTSALAFSILPTTKSTAHTLSTLRPPTIRPTETSICTHTMPETYSTPDRSAEREGDNVVVRGEIISLDTFDMNFVGCGEQQ
jgi:hypothetical protein